MRRIAYVTWQKTASEFIHPIEPIARRRGKARLQTVKRSSPQWKGDLTTTKPCPLAIMKQGGFLFLEAKSINRKPQYDRGFYKGLASIDFLFIMRLCAGNSYEYEITLFLCQD